MQGGGDNMPEIPLCYYCRKSIDLAKDGYAVINKEEVEGDKEKYKYAHVACQDKRGG